MPNEQLQPTRERNAGAQQARQGILRRAVTARCDDVLVGSRSGRHRKVEGC
jgi:hypothetical protein